MIGKDEIKKLATDRKELTTEIQRDSPNKNKVISNFPQIIHSTKKEYQNPIEKN